MVSPDSLDLDSGTDSFDPDLGFGYAWKGVETVPIKGERAGRFDSNRESGSELEVSSVVVVWMVNRGGSRTFFLERELVRASVFKVRSWRSLLPPSVGWSWDRGRGRG